MKKHVRRRKYARAVQRRPGHGRRDTYKHACLVVKAEAEVARERRLRRYVTSACGITAEQYLAALTPEERTEADAILETKGLRS